MGAPGHAAPTCHNPALRAQVKLKVLAVLGEGYSVGYAAEQGGVNRSTVLAWRDSDPEFAAAWAAAWERGSDWVEDRLRAQVAKGIPVSTIVALKMRKRFVERESSDPEDVARQILTQMRQIAQAQRQQALTPGVEPVSQEPSRESARDADMPAAGTTDTRDTGSA